MADDELRLERIHRRHESLLREMAAEYLEAGEDRWEPVLTDAHAFFESVDRFALGEDLPADRVQQTQFLLFCGDRLLGASRLRHRLIPILHDDGGNIGYDIRPNERRRGYGAAILARTLEEARKIGLEKVLLTTEPDNAGSIRIIERGGGLADGSAISHVSGEEMLRFWIAL